MVLLSHPLFEQSEDPELQELARYLPTAVLQSKANSTAKKYLGAIQRWKQWALSHILKTFPVTSNYLALYLQLIEETAQSKSAVEEIVHAMAWLHDAAGLLSPTTNPL